MTTLTVPQLRISSNVRCVRTKSQEALPKIIDGTTLQITAKPEKSSPRPSVSGNNFSSFNPNAPNVDGLQIFPKLSNVRQYRARQSLVRRQHDQTTGARSNNLKKQHNDSTMQRLSGTARRQHALMAVITFPSGILDHDCILLMLFV
jgi:hypothetical protein